MSQLQDSVEATFVSRIVHVTHFVRRAGPRNFSIERLYEDVRSALPRDCTVKVWTCRNYSKGFWPRLEDAWRARGAQGEVNHVTGDVHYLTLLLDRRRTILTIHDLVSIERLHGFRRWALWFVWYWLAVRRSHIVVAISESTRQQLLESLGCEPSKIRVIHNCHSDEFRPVSRPFDAERPRILQVGTSPNKNLDRVAEALSGVCCVLVIIGPLTQAQRSALDRHNIEYENYTGLTRDALAAQYVAADIVLFASVYEGFGLPIIEANAVGRPVVTSNILSMPEVAGSAACYVDPFDATSIRAGVCRVIKDRHFRECLIEAGFSNARRFSASAVAGKYAALYREVADLRRGAA